MTSDRQSGPSERELEADAVRRLRQTRARDADGYVPADRPAERRSWLTRTTDEVASWFGDTNAMRRRQWDEAAGDHAGKGPTRYLDADTRIVEVLNNRLTVDRELDASNVQVSAHDGVVTLEGAVSTLAGAQRAERLALAVHDVRGVINHLDVV